MNIPVNDGWFDFVHYYLENWNVPILIVFAVVGILYSITTDHFEFFLKLLAPGLLSLLAVAVFLYPSGIMGKDFSIVNIVGILQLFLCFMLVFVAVLLEIFVIKALKNYGYFESKNQGI